MGEKASTSALFDFILEGTVGVGLISWIQGYGENGPAEEVLKKGIKEQSHFEVRWPSKDTKKSNPIVPAIIMETGNYVKSIFPDVEENSVKTSIRNKLKYESVKINGRQYQKALKKSSVTPSTFDETNVSPSIFDETNVSPTIINEEIENVSQCTSNNMPNFFDTFIKYDFATEMVLV